MAKPIISADSHITEPPDTYVDHIDRRFRDRAPHVVHDAKRGDVFVIDGMDKPIPMGLVAAAGKPAEELRMSGARFEDMHRGGWDPEARLGEQDARRRRAEVIYPTVGMMLCNHPDFDYKNACFDAYNRWIAEYCAAHPDRLLGFGQTAMRSLGGGHRGPARDQGARAARRDDAGQSGRRGLRRSHLRRRSGGGRRPRPAARRSTS